MASPLAPTARATAAGSAPMSTNNQDGSSAADSELAQSLDQLSLSTFTSPKHRSPPNFAAATFQHNRSPSMSTWPSSTRSSTPSLARKTSNASVRSASKGSAQRRRGSSMSEPRPTVESMARDHFLRELAALHGGDAAAAAETVVVLHDSCYGHRYSRPRTSRASLSTIVERPERIKACALGVAAAYVRLGERHQDGAHPPHGALGASVPFRIHRSTRRLALSCPAVTNVHGTRWMEELTTMCHAAESKLAINGKELQRPIMDRGAGADVAHAFHEGDLYLCSGSLDALEGSLGGLCDAVDEVFASQGPKRAFVAIRPPGHHCSASYPAGFCWINNVHVGIMHAILSHGLTHAAIIDFDLHHGDGSQAVAWEHNARGVGLAKKAAWWKKTSIGYFSLHDINSYPCEMGDEEKVKNASLCIEKAHGQNVWNVHLQPWTTMAEFWTLYESRYMVLLDKVRAYLRGQTERLRAGRLQSKAAIFLSAGFDASEWEGQGMQRHSVNVPTDFYARLTRDVVRMAADEGTSVEGRIISVLEGGYSDRALCSGVLSHLSGLAGDDPVSTKERIGSIHHVRKDSEASERGARPYEAEWWSVAALEQLETTAKPPVAVEARKPPPTYSSPTHASRARVVSNTLKPRRSTSGLSASADTPRPPTPPPQGVSWHVAAHELSKLLVPTDRTTESCKAEDLNAEATRARRDRQSTLAQSQALSSSERGPTRMALRERKPKPMVTDDDHEELPVPRASSRRRSVASTPKSPEPALPPRPASTTGLKADSTTTTGLVVKKTRPVKKAAATRVPRAIRTMAASAPAATVASAGENEKAGDGMDGLADSMKKIKITLVTPSMRLERERKARAAALVGNAQIPSTMVAGMTQIQSTVEKTENQSTTMVENTKIQYPDTHHDPPASSDLCMAATRAPAWLPTNGGGSPTDLDGAYPALPANDPAYRLPSPESVVSISPACVPLPASSPPASTDDGLNDDSPGKAQSTTPCRPRQLAQQQQQSPKSSPMRRAQLPVFTPTSTIPFAPRGQSQQQP